MIRDRVQQTSTTPGTGTLTLDGTVAGYRTFGSAFANTDPVYFCVVDGAQWEVIEGIFNTGNTLTRSRTLASSTGSPISFTGAAKQVFNVAPAELLGPLFGRLDMATATNTGSDYTVLYKPAVPALIDGMRGAFRVSADNAGATTLKVSALAAKPLRRSYNGSVIALAAGDLHTNQIVEWRYDATADLFIWINAPEFMGVKDVAGTTYTVLSTDCGRLLRFSNASGCAVTLPQPTAGGVFDEPWCARFVAAGGTVTITTSSSQIDGAGALRIQKSDACLVATDGSNYFTNRGPGPGAVIASARNLTWFNNTGAPNSQVDITADEVVLKDPSGRTMVAANVSVTIDITASGANGLDTGSEASNTHYYLWLIGSGSVVAGLISASPTAPTIPAGYIFKALVGTIRNNGSSNFNLTRGQDRRVWFGAPINVLANVAPGTPGTLQSLAATAVLPSIAKTVSGLLGMDSAGTDLNYAISVAANAAGLGLRQFAAYNYTATALGNFAKGGSFADLPLVTAQTLFWTANTAGAVSRIDLTEFTI